MERSIEALAENAISKALKAGLKVNEASTTMTEQIGFGKKGVMYPRFFEFTVDGQF